MMKKRCIISGVFGLILATNVLAENAVSHASNASGHSVAASGHTAVSVGQVAVSVVEIPLKVVALAGESMQTAGDSLIAVTHRRPRPLEITEITITVDPSPQQMVNQPQQQE